MEFAISNILNIPNQLTIFRVILVPVFVVAIYFDAPLSNKISAFIFGVASFTDFIDGYIARKYKLVTRFGKILDPIADKILVAAALIVLVDLGRIPAWLVIVLLGREFAIGALRDYAASEGVVIPAGWSGKIKTTVQMIAIGFLSYQNDLYSIPVTLIGNILIYLSVVISVYSGFEYYRNYFNNRS